MENLTIIILILLLVRTIEFYLFMRKLSKLCYKYDWKYVDRNEHLLIEMFKKDYWLTNEWSAYNFIYLKNDNPINYFFSFKLFNLTNIYDKEVIKKLEENEVI